MIDTPELVDVPARKIAKIHLVVPSKDIMTHMGAGLKEVRQALAEQNIKASGAWLTHHFKVPNTTFDFEICIPVETDVAPQGRVGAGELRAARIARTVYNGNYSGLPNGWVEFMTWIHAHELQMAGDFCEAYTVGPDDSTDPADWRTELSCPLQV